MSSNLLNLVNQFLIHEIEPQKFVDEYISLWQLERGEEWLTLNSPDMQQKLSSIFCLADMFNGEDDRDENEFDEDRLRYEIKRELAGLPFDPNVKLSK